jgi:predicted phage terminase large subunit-like protein
MAELLEDVPGALWTQELIDKHKVRTYPTPFTRIVVPIDPAVSTGENSSETGIGVVGLGRDGHIYVLEDLSGKYAPMEWARIAIEALKRWRADLIVGEVNNGGDLVEANLRAVNPNIPFRQVRASRGKLRRAEPVANLYEQGRVHHVIMAADPTNLQQLESQMCSYVAGMDQDSPDRMDALVWGITELLIDVEQTQTYEPIVSRVQISRF